jgi:CBS domain-containing protein
MKIKDLLEEKGNEVVTIDGDQSIHAAIVKLNHHGIGSLIVTDEDGQIAGIVTERDILKSCGSNCTHLQTPPPREQIVCPFLVKDIMTRDLVIGVPGDDLNYVMGVMIRHRIRHLPILDNGKLAGMISVGDMINAHFEENIFESRTLKEYIHTWGHSH